MTVLKISEIVKNKEEVEVEIPADIAKFQENDSTVDFSIAQEMAPSPMAFDGNNKWLISHLVEGELNRIFTRLFLEVYENGGKILYQKLPSGNYKASVSWA